MAFNKPTAARNNARNAAPAQGERNGPAVLGYINIGIGTNIPGDSRRVDSIRLMDNNPLHQVIFAGLNAQREGDPDFVVPEGASAKERKAIEEARNALLEERLKGFMSKLTITFNPARGDADSDLISF